MLLCIQWVLFAKGPLKAEELYYAVLSGMDPGVDWFKSSDITEDDARRFVLDSSKGLAELTASSNKEAETVQFIHESVRDFLLKEKGLSQI